MIPRLERPWLDVPLPGRMRTLGWCLNAPGFGHADSVHWREVRDDDLGPGLDVESWLSGELSRSGRTGPCFLTSRDIGAHFIGHSPAGDASVDVVATVGLSNAERIGHHERGPGPFGTINVLATVTAPLTDGALVEALSLVVEARTAAVIEGGPDLPTGRATGTGTDCVLVACASSADRATGAAEHAGKHTEIGRALGSAVRDSVALAVDGWMREFG